MDTSEILIYEHLETKLKNLRLSYDQVINSILFTTANISLEFCSLSELLEFLETLISFGTSFNLSTESNTLGSEEQVLLRVSGVHFSFCPNEMSLLTLLFLISVNFALFEEGLLFDFSSS